MLVVYDSKTGNVQRFVNKLKLPDNKLLKINQVLKVQEPYILITYTTGIAQVPRTTLDFLQFNHDFLKGVISSGNRNWGQYFASSADQISNMYEVPILHKFEMSGSEEDVRIVIERMDDILHETLRVK
jgi:protein involved in ribonucleotide reduction